MKLFCKEKPLYYKVDWLVLDSNKLLGVFSPLLGWLFGVFLSGLFNLKITTCTYLGFLIGFIFTFFTFPLWFVKSTAQPSSFQRFCRNYAIGIARFYSFIGLASQAGDAIYPKDIRFFQYYLSHPQEPENIWADQIDTTRFDWQNPEEWKIPLINLQSQKKDEKERGI